MDAESVKKEETLLKIRDEAYEWVNNPGDKYTDFHANCLRLKAQEFASDKFINDHNGYLVALGEYKAHKKALDARQTAPDRAARAVKELEELKANFGD